jgi:hypothetical protein
MMDIYIFYVSCVPIMFSYVLNDVPQVFREFPMMLFLNGCCSP